MNDKKDKPHKRTYQNIKERELTDSEKAERQALRQEYINDMKASLTGQLDNTYILYPDGKKSQGAEKNYNIMVL